MLTFNKVSTTKPVHRLKIVSPRLPIFDHVSKNEWWLMVTAPLALEEVYKFHFAILSWTQVKCGQAVFFMMFDKTENKTYVYIVSY